MGYWPSDEAHLAEDFDTLTALRDAMAERAQAGDRHGLLVMQVVTVFIDELAESRTQQAEVT